MFAIVLNVAGLVLFVIAALLTRAGSKRAAAAVIAGFAAIFAGALMDIAGYHLGWWTYVGATVDRASTLIYAGFAWLVAGVTLVGWKITVHFGRPGFFGFLGVTAVVFAANDWAGSWIATHTPLHFSPQRFAPGLLPILGDIVLWAIVYALAHGIMRAIAGPAVTESVAAPAYEVR